MMTYADRFSNRSDSVAVSETSDMCGGCADGDHVNPYAVGSIWHTSWGYDQTNEELYTVVRETAASVWLVPMRYEVRDGRKYPTEPVLWSMGPTDIEGVYPAKMHRKPRAAWAVDSPYLHLDYVRDAWPYEGGGCYDTRAAGQPGH